jgi:hypothetical protein
LVLRHGAGAGISEQIDEDVLGPEQKRIVPGGGEECDALFAGREADRLHGLDAERLDDGLERGMHGAGSSV